MCKYTISLWIGRVKPCVILNNKQTQRSMSHIAKKQQLSNNIEPSLDNIAKLQCKSSSLHRQIPRYSSTALPLHTHFISFQKVEREREREKNRSRTSTSSYGQTRPSRSRATHTRTRSQESFIASPRVFFLPPPRGSL